MRNNYRKMIAHRLATLNKLDYAPYQGCYRLDNDGSHYCIAVGDRRLSSYLTLSELYEWLDGYGTALYDVLKQRLDTEAEKESYGL